MRSRESSCRWVPRSPQEATARYTQACNAGLAVACYELATLYQTGAGGTRDTRLSKEWMQKACAAGEPRACPAIPQPPSRR